MQSSNEIVSSYANVQRFETKPLADNERNAVAYFFMKLRIADPRFYDQAMPDEKTAQFTKREFSEFIRGFTKAKIDKGFLELNKLLAAGNPEYKFLTIQKVIGLIANGGASEGNPAGAHKVFERVTALEDLTAREKRIELGKQEASKLLDMFDKPEVKPEADNTLAKQRLAEAMEKLK